MKVVLDTNILISGLFWRGAPFRILDAWRRRLFLGLWSPSIYTEYRRVAIELNALRSGVNATEFIDFFVSQSESIADTILPDQVCTDADDDKFIACALAGRASFVVSGDRALVKIERYSGIKIVTATVFLKHLGLA